MWGFESSMSSNIRSFTGSHTVSLGGSSSCGGCRCCPVPQLDPRASLWYQKEWLAQQLVFDQPIPPHTHPQPQRYTSCVEMLTAFTPDQPCSHSMAPHDIVPQVCSCSLPCNSQHSQQGAVSATSHPCPLCPAHCAAFWPSLLPAVPRGSSLHTQHEDT